MPQLLATFVQISDLHIGELDPVFGNAALDKRFIRVASTFKRLDGLLGHHGTGLTELASFVRDVRPSEGEFRVIVTGDLTRSGSQKEQDLATDYLLGQIDIQPPAGNMVGLKLQKSELICIPGNHDQWGGSWHPLGSAKKCFVPPVPTQATPYVVQVPLANNRKVAFVAFDSDADVGRGSWKRFWAIGSFLNELAAQIVQLPANTNADIRIALVHHSLSVNTYELKLDKLSKAALIMYMQHKGIRAMLSGHTHLFSLPPQLGSGASYEELRCGSTTQHDVIPYNWMTLAGNTPKKRWEQNTLLLHQIFGSLGQTTWKVQAYGRFSNAGFQSLGHQHSFEMLV